jgi:anti-anti-sigma regulatory factor
MATPLEIVCSGESAHTLVTMRGDIDEKARFDTVSVSTGNVVLNLANVTSINSTGVRAWIQFMSRLTAKASVSVEACSPSMVSQINMVSNFLKGARVLSFQAPYACEACETLEAILLTPSDLNGQMSVAPARNCSRCGKQLVFDDMEDGYFAFLKST